MIEEAHRAAVFAVVVFAVVVFVVVVGVAVVAVVPVYLEMLFLLGFSDVDSRKEAEERRRDNFRSFFSFCLSASSLAYSLASALDLAIRARFWALTRRAR